RGRALGRSARAGASATTGGENRGGEHDDDEESAHGAILPLSSHVNADDVPVLERPHLHQVAQLVRQPEPAPAHLVEDRLQTTGHRLLYAAGVLDLGEEEAAVLPDLQHARASAVADAVRGDLVHGEEQA